MERSRIQERIERKGRHNFQNIDSLINPNHLYENEIESKDDGAGKVIITS